LRVETVIERFFLRKLLLTISLSADESLHLVNAFLRFDENCNHVETPKEINDAIRALTKSEIIFIVTL
jgi:hypothetical protein